ncbi:MAG: GNAT family N-acetyltransferase [Steroidobacteraceae bacterium]
MNITLRQGRPEDAQRGGLICYEAFKAIAEQHHFPPDFPSAEVAIGLLSSLLARPDIYSVVAEIDGRLAGSNFLWENASIAGIGPITVDPKLQNGQVGKQLMNNVLERARAQEFAGTRLVQAAYHGRSLSLYAKLGFAVREPLAILQGPALDIEVKGFSVRQATGRDVESCNKLCRNVHGHDRNHELLDAIKQKTASVVDHDGRISGYATMIGFFGHAVGETNEDMKALIGAATGIAGPGLLLPTRNSELFRWCLHRGLRVVQPMTLMSLDLYNEPAGAFLPSVIY